MLLNQLRFKDYLLFAAGGEEPEQLQAIFAAGMKQTAAIEGAHVYLLRSWDKTAAIKGSFFFLILFSIYCCVYTKTAANDKQQIRFFPLVYVSILKVFKDFWHFCV